MKGVRKESPIRIASIDIGTHTARLLVARRIGDSGRIRRIVRERIYIRVGEDFGEEGEGAVSEPAQRRTISALETFASVLQARGVQKTVAVATGVWRRAVNRDECLREVYERTGIRVKVIPGEEEARLTGRGVLRSLKIEGRPFVIFDLGGGTTEFLIGGEGKEKALTLPLGAMVLTKMHIRSDPAPGEEIDAIAGRVDDVLSEAFPKRRAACFRSLLVGTGGTVTTLGAVIRGLGVEEIGPERLNGAALRRDDIEGIFQAMKGMNTAERKTLRGLDEGRADVILAGTTVVIRIMHFFGMDRMKVSVSDLLEGMLLTYLER